VACVRHAADGTIKHQVRTFKTTTRDLLALSEWLVAEGCTHVAMEATGILLEAGVADPERRRC
jgi:transposase